MATYFDRYKEFRNNGSTYTLPMIKLQPMSGDKYVAYRLGSTRMDKLSQTYYGNPWHGFLIMCANPEFGGLEFSIPDKTILRIPFPLNDAIQQYNNLVGDFINLYGVS